jgi:RHS repeat-associated protein
MTVAGQTAVNYGWDNANRLTGITQGSSSVALNYDAANRRTSLTLPNGVAVAYTYDSDAHVTGITYNMGSTQLGSLVYRYDVDGRTVERSGSLAGTNMPAIVGSTAYNADNELTNWGGLPLTYDNNGNMTQGINGNQYTWDGRNHMTAIASNPAASFVYDAFGRRAKKTINGTTTQFLYDGFNPVQELNSSNVATANLLTGLNIDEFFSRTDSSGARSFLTDILGSTLALTDSSGTIQTQYTYEPFGNATVSGAANGNSYQFTGRENDATGLYYYRARYYSPTFQRFTAQDPIDFAGGDTNLYGYTSNDPVDYRDATGKLLIGGLLTGGACGAYFLYQHYSLLSDENALANQLTALRQQIRDLQNQEDSCPTINPQPERQIAELDQKAFDLTRRLAAAHAADAVKGLATIGVCVGLTAVAGTFLPF